MPLVLCHTVKIWSPLCSPSLRFWIENSLTILLMIFNQAFLPFPSSFGSWDCLDVAEREWELHLLSEDSPCLSAGFRAACSYWKQSEKSRGNCYWRRYTECGLPGCERWQVLIVKISLHFPILRYINTLMQRPNVNGCHLTGILIGSLYLKELSHKSVTL